MKATELAKYLEHAPDDIDYQVITEEQYNALVIIAYKYCKIYNEVLADCVDTQTELATIKTMIMNPAFKKGDKINEILPHQIST